MLAAERLLEFFQVALDSEFRDPKLGGASPERAGELPRGAAKDRVHLSAVLDDDCFEVFDLLGEPKNLALAGEVVLIFGCAHDLGIPPYF